MGTYIFLNSVIIAEGREGPGLAFEGGSFKPMYQDSRTDLQSTSSYGISLDYQWHISQSFSFSVLAFEHGGKSMSPPKSDHEYYKSGLLGAEIKAWISSFFIGIHFGEYYLTWIENLSNFTGINRASGYGFGLGIETKSGWMIAAYRENSEKIKIEDLPDQKLEGDRILVGYRWN